MKRRFGPITAMVAVGALVLSACGASNTDSGSESSGESASGTTESAASQYAECSLTDGAADASSESEGDTDVVIGAFSGWDESIASAYLMQNLLEQNGYTADVQTLDAAAAFTATAGGDVDVLTDVWLPSTHETYLEQYGDRMEALGCWYDSAQLTIAVNSSSPAQSIADLKDMAADYGNTLVGIEPGAGETKIVQETVIPDYGLEDLNFVTSSTAAMLASIQQAETNNTNVAVTLWRPHWAYSAFDIRDLEDPMGGMGGKEGIWNFGTAGFGDASPKAAQMFRNFVLPDEDLSELEDLMTQKYGGDDPEGAVNEWLQGHPDFASELVSGSLG